jgi:uncharacterized membrane protein (UPF0127 family)
MTRYLRWSIVAACALLLQYAVSALPRVGMVANCGPTRFVVVAATRAERVHGIQQDRDFRGSSGMLFVYDEPQRPAFWMQETHIPLGIVFFDPEYRVISTAEMLPFTTVRHAPTAPIIAALEVRADVDVRRAYPIGTRCTIKLPM